jgi:DNA-binding NarL/FixJ family response regulator
MIRILLVDDQALVRAGFRMILDAEPEVEVVGEAANGREAVERAAELRPDVILLDIRMPEMDGLEAARRILANADEGSPKLLMLTTFDLDEYIFEALCAGASGFLLKDTPPEQLVDAIHVIAAGESLLSPSVTRQVIAHYVRGGGPQPQAQFPKLELLTPRELEVLKLLARGLSNAELASALYLSETTVKTHVARILMKLDLRDRVQAVVLAYEAGVVQPGDAAVVS